MTATAMPVPTTHPPSPSAGDDERAWLGLARLGEAERERAVQSIHARYKDEVFGFLLKMLADRPLAEDVLQESFLAVHAHLEQYDPARPFRPWLYGIVRNSALRALRSERKVERLAVRAARPEATAGLHPELEARETIERARAALGRLPEESRALLLQRHGLGMKLDELADSFEVTDRTVRNRLRTAAQEFARALLSSGTAPARDVRGDQ